MRRWVRLAMSQARLIGLDEPTTTTFMPAQAGIQRNAVA
jgi:hypothetical protein